MINVCLFGDCRESMRKMIADGVKVQTCVTSPPYWGLRDYGTATWEGGDAGCDHRQWLGGNGSASAKQVTSGGTQRYNYRDLCGKCGARRIDSQLGLESTPDEYVTNMVEVFGLVRDLLADDGTLWLNLGDSYASGEIGRHDGYNPTGDSSKPFGARQQARLRSGLKPKDLVGIPWRVAFALQAAGWYLRSDIIWAKPNPMPESVTDRPTKAHEYLFLMSKRERYFYDAAAISEASEQPERAGKIEHSFSTSDPSSTLRQDTGRSVLRTATRNRRTVWTVATEPYSEAHFATFPTALIEPCILAGTSQKGHCPACGKGWARVVERETVRDHGGTRDMDKTPLNVVRAGWRNGGPQSMTLGWQPSCACNLEPVPGIVLDPFLGSGTTAQVAQDLGRHWLGCELSQEYGKLQTRRTAQLGMALEPTEAGESW